MIMTTQVHFPSRLQQAASFNPAVKGSVRSISSTKVLTEAFNAYLSANNQRIKSCSHCPYSDLNSMTSNPRFSTLIQKLLLTH